ncbi:uncharacterized protein AMSG_07709 [Thecamonas trahens ATCC 50062]|uniref:Uncharacterized protein n=1 Tax=Thecamonas trahens ATCC 50062 TaxID=461836 RepID=A0A0L0DHR7_THETB|nr:hypothetical protein AMSG_07709 [Thecamonas trahens ATCC 50062]KNC51646.1 hypothetical protein AMSG_07709 [Thecamonas trahens ATCC 50062]|eukprot:XP_013755786.1 hypothetical protein AMSG_07709 [Thecamonas trahens ATCC 50062]
MLVTGAIATPHALEAARIELATLSSALQNKSEVIAAREAQLETREADVSRREADLHQRILDLRQGEDEVLRGARMVANAQAEADAQVVEVEAEFKMVLGRTRARLASVEEELVRVRALASKLKRAKAEAEEKAAKQLAATSESEAKLSAARKRIAKLEHKLMLTKTSPSVHSPPSASPGPTPPSPTPASPSKPSSATKAARAAYALSAALMTVATAALAGERVPRAQLVGLAPLLAPAVRLTASRPADDQAALLQMVLAVERAALSSDAKAPYSVRKLGDDVFAAPRNSYLAALEPEVQALAALAVIGARGGVDKVSGALNVLRSLVQRDSVRAILHQHAAPSLFLAALSGAATGRAVCPLWSPLAAVLLSLVSADTAFAAALATPEWMDALATAVPVIDPQDLDSLSVVIQNIAATPAGATAFAASTLKPALLELRRHGTLSDFAGMNIDAALAASTPAPR